MKTMYILIRDIEDKSHAILGGMHGVAACVFKWKDHPDMIEWRENSFRKTLCMVNDKEFSKAIQERDCVVMTEGALNGAQTCAVFLPREREDYPKYFKYFKLWK